GFHGLAILLLAPFYDALPEWSEATVQSALVIAGTFIVATRVAPVNIKIATLLRIMLAIASTVWGYERARAIIGLTWGTPSLEGYFINADIAVFGGNPSEWMQAIHHPVLTEYLQMAYLTYFLLPLILCLTLIYAGRWR